MNQQQPTAKKSYRELWLIATAHGLTHWYPATFFLLLPLIGKELGLSYSQIGLAMTCQYVAGALSNIPGGMLVDTIGKRGLLMAAALFWVGVPYLLMGFTHSYWALLLCTSLVGMGNNLWHPSAIPTMAERYPDRKGLVLSLHGMAGNLGDAVAPLAIGALLLSFGWRQIVMMNVLPGLVMSGILLASLGALRSGRSMAAEKPAEGQSVAEYLRGLRELLRNRTLLILTTSSVFRSMTQSTLLTFLPVFLAYEMHYASLWVGTCMFMLQAAGFAASPVAGHLSDKMGRRRIIMSSLAMSAVVLLSMAFAGKSPVFIFLIAFLGFFLYAVRGVLQAWLLDATPKRMGGTSIAMLFGMQAVGGSIGPVVGGLLADRYGLMATFYFLAGSIVFANLFIFFMPPQADGLARAASRA